MGFEIKCLNLHNNAFGRLCRLARGVFCSPKQQQNTKKKEKVLISCFLCLLVCLQQATVKNCCLNAENNEFRSILKCYTKILVFHTYDVSIAVKLFSMPMPYCLRFWKLSFFWDFGLIAMNSFYPIIIKTKNKTLTFNIWLTPTKNDAK